MNGRWAMRLAESGQDLRIFTHKIAPVSFHLLNFGFSILDFGLNSIAAIIWALGNAFARLRWKPTAIPSDQRLVQRNFTTEPRSLQRVFWTFGNRFRVYARLDWVVATRISRLCGLTDTDDDSGNSSPFGYSIFCDSPVAVEMYA